MIATDRTKEEIIKEINFLVEDKIQPSVAMHGGEVRLEDFNMETGVALMLMSGSCSGCSSSTVTLKLGVENMLKHYVPEVKAVEGVDDPNFNDPYYT
jgi:NFU1 iron-sulfur cluster scaffold homolog, mitochondrial|tara:strand:+ start:23442 stop:23732 length:291 start_codon:yes stop_codon:yes gene_type:complete